MIHIPSLLEFRRRVGVLVDYEFEDVESIYCKFCDKRIKVVLVNDFISHLIEEHNVSVENVVIGDGVQIDTNIGLVEI